MGDRNHPTSEHGFTLVELMVVILIIGLLIAIALPTFLGARARAQDRRVQTDLRTGLAVALTYFSDLGTYDGFDAAMAEAMEPALTWNDAGPPPQGEIAIQLAAGRELLLVSLSGSGTYFCLSQLANSPATDRGKGAAFADVDTSAECTGGW